MPGFKRHPQNVSHSMYPKTSFQLPSGKLIWQWNIRMFPGKYHPNGGFSIAMLVYHRVPWSIFDPPNVQAGDPDSWDQELISISQPGGFFSSFSRRHFFGRFHDSHPWIRIGLMPPCTTKKFADATIFQYNSIQWGKALTETIETHLVTSCNPTFSLSWKFSHMMDSLAKSKENRQDTTGWLCPLGLPVSSCCATMASKTITAQAKRMRWAARQRWKVYQKW